MSVNLKSNFLGQWSFKKKCFWDLLTFSRVAFVLTNLYSCQSKDGSFVKFRLHLSDVKRKCCENLENLKCLLKAPSDRFFLATNTLTFKKLNLKSHSKLIISRVSTNPLKTHLVRLNRLSVDIWPSSFSMNMMNYDTL